MGSSSFHFPTETESPDHGGQQSDTFSPTFSLSSTLQGSRTSEWCGTASQKSAHRSINFQFYFQESGELFTYDAI